MTEQPYTRGTVVKGPDLLGPHDYRPYVCPSTEDPPFRDEEAVYAVVTTTRRSAAIPLARTEFSSCCGNRFISLCQRRLRMGTKQVRLDEDVYARIANEKRPNETFSEAVERLITDWSLTEFDLGLDEGDTKQFADAVEQIEATTAENLDETLDELNANSE